MRYFPTRQKQIRQTKNLQTKNTKTKKNSKQQEQQNNHLFETLGKTKQKKHKPNNQNQKRPNKHKHCCETLGRRESLPLDVKSSEILVFFVLAFGIPILVALYLYFFGVLETCNRRSWEGGEQYIYIYICIYIYVIMYLFIEIYIYIYIYRDRLSPKPQTPKPITIYSSRGSSVSYDSSNSWRNSADVSLGRNPIRFRV